MSNFKVELVHESMMNFVGKNMFYCMDTNVMYWCDILGGQVFKMDMMNHNTMTMFKLLGEKTISFCVPIHGKKDQFIVGAGRRLLLVTWDGFHTMGQIVKVLVEIPVTGVRIHQCKLDKQGRLWFGTMINEEQGDIMDYNKRIGSLYRYTMQDGLVMMKEKIGLGNGITWNSTFTKMYFVDSYDTMIYEFDYDLKTGTMTNQKVLIDLTTYCQKGKIFPGSMTMDVDDHIYVCMFGLGKFFKISTKTHKIEQEIKLLVEQPTGIAFGGKHLDMLYIISSCMGLHKEQTYPSGYMMKVSNVGTTGYHMHKFVM